MPPLLNSSHRVSPPLNRSHLFLSSSQLLSPLVNSSQLLPTLLTSFHRDASHRETFTHRSFYTEKALHTASVHTEKAFTHRSFYTEQAFTPSTHKGYTNCSSKTGWSRRQSGKTTILKRLWKEIYLFLNTFLKIISAKARMEKFCCPNTSPNLHAATTWESRFSAAKHNSTASAKKRKSYLETSVTVRAQVRHDFALKRRRPHPSRKRANFSPQRNLGLSEKTYCNVSCNS